MRESSVHAILKQHSKSNLLIADHSKERLRDRSQRQSPNSQVILNDTQSVRIKDSEGGKDRENGGAEGMMDFTPKKMANFSSNLTSMQLIISEGEQNGSEHQSQSQESPSADVLMKKFHSQQSNQIFKLNNAKVRLVLKGQNEGQVNPDDQSSQLQPKKQQKMNVTHWLS